MELLIGSRLAVASDEMLAVRRVAGLSVALSAAAIYGSGQPAQAIPWVASAPFLSSAIIVDAREHRLPTELLRAAFVVGWCAIAVSALFGGGLAGPLGAATGMFVGAALTGAIWAVSPSSLGFGDVRLAGVLGSLVGVIDPWAVPTSLALASILCVPMLLVVRQDGHRAVAFGPAMVIAAYLMPALTNGTT